MHTHSTTRARWHRMLVALLVVTALVAGACGDDDDTGSGDPAGADGASSDGEVPGGRLSIATGGTSGVYFVYGGGLAEVITSNLDGVEATAEVTSASVDNLLLLDDGDADLAFSLADTAADAIGGEEGFDEPLDLVALARLYTNFTQVVTLASSDIETVDDLDGQRVSTGSPNSGTEVIANRILETAGVEVEREQLGINESVQALRDGVVEAFFWSGGLPTGGITDLSSTDDIRLLPLDDVLGGMRDTYGDFYAEAEVPAGTYGMDEAVATIGVDNFLVVRPDLDEDLAFALTELLFEHRSDLAAVHPEAENLDVETAQDVAPMDLHPGATRYYDTAAA